MKVKKRIIIIISVLAACLVIIKVLSRNTVDDLETYISPPADKIAYDDVRDYLRKMDFSRIKESGYLKSGKTVNRHTVRFFKYIQGMFKDKSYEDHIAAVREYFMSVMEPEEADKLLVYYQKFLKYEDEAASVINSEGKLESPGDYLRILSRLKKLQVSFFGKEDAEILYGAEIKAREYPVRRGAIMYDSSLYGKDKEKRIAELNSDMWGDQAEEIENSRKPYIKYQEKLSLYDRDLKDMNETTRGVKIREFREEIFPPDVVERLNAVDKILEAESDQNRAYKFGYEKIVNDSTLNDAEKQQKITELQNTIYGEQAESIRQIEEMERGKQELLNEYTK